MMNLRKQTLLIGLGLALLTAAVFWQVTGFEFVSFDDASYIPDNPHVRNGLSLDGVVWAFTTPHHGYWHPVAYVVHMLNCQFLGLNAGAHHAVNLLLHIANVLLLFGLLARLTGSAGRSAFAAALFAVHPLHVESVAWIAELKDLVSTMFWLLTVWAYALYATRARRGAYWLSVALYAVGLMTKPMILTLPVVLLLLDYWPLNRLTSERWRRLAAEKIPFFLLAIASAAVTFLTAAHSGVTGSMTQYPAGVRAANVVAAYGTYLFKMVWPDRLACLYPYNPHLPAWQVGLSAAALLAVSGIALGLGLRKRHLLTGWLWFLAMLLPVIGIVQAGPQSMADRYSYLSLVGVFIMIAWSVPIGRAEIPAAIASAVVLLFAARAWFQVGTWKDSQTLFRHAIAVTENNVMAHNNLGLLLADEGRLDEAVVQYHEALKINPGFLFALNNLGNAMMQEGRLDEAVRCFRNALEIAPAYAEAHNNLGIALAKLGRIDESADQFLEALKANPSHPGRQRNLLSAIEKLQDKEKAAMYYRAALEIAEASNERNLADLIREKEGARSR